MQIEYIILGALVLNLLWLIRIEYLLRRVHKAASRRDLVIGQ